MTLFYTIVAVTKTFLSLLAISSALLTAIPMIDFKIVFMIKIDL